MSHPQKSVFHSFFELSGNSISRAHFLSSENNISGAQNKEVPIHVSGEFCSQFVSILVVCLCFKPFSISTFSTRAALGTISDIDTIS